MTARTVDRTSARQRLLNAANDLFYEEGVHTVGIDRVIERAGVAKATLYNAFGSKEELVRAYLQLRAERIRARMTTELAARFVTPRDRLVGVFDIQGESFAMPGFRGCAFQAASAEASPGGAAEQASDEFREWLRSLLFDLAREAGAPQPRQLAEQLVLVYDGAGMGARMDRNPAAALVSREIAQLLVDTALGPKP